MTPLLDLEQGSKDLPCNQRLQSLQTLRFDSPAFFRPFFADQLEKMARTATITLALCIVFCVAHEAAAARIGPQESLGGRLLQQMRGLKKGGGAFNDIEHGLVNFGRGGDGAGTRSNCKAWNSLGGISTALNAQGIQTSPPEDVAGRNCPGVVTEYNNGK